MEMSGRKEAGIREEFDGRAKDQKCLFIYDLDWLGR
jgi:hypothetical protein